MIVYRVINKVNGKSYIGVTSLDLGQRKHKHWLNSKNPDKNKKQAFYLAINKYGWESFEWQELCSALSKEDLMSLERDFIKEYNTYTDGYNNTVGGEGVISPQKQERYLVRFPDGSARVVTGYNKFCRDHGLNNGNLWATLNPKKATYHINGRHYTYLRRYNHHKGYALLGKFNDYLGTEYLQTEGSGGIQKEDSFLEKDIV